MLRRTWIIAASLVCASASSSLAVNAVVVESKTVETDETGVTIGVFIENDVALQGLTLPLEIRARTGGAFPAAAFAFDTAAGGRVAGSGLIDFVVRTFHPDPMPVSDPGLCDGKTAGSYLRQETTPVDFFTSPDAVFWVGVAGLSPDLTTGADGSTPSFEFRFDVGPAAGIFDIDTCCITPANHLIFALGPFTGVIPEFVRGTVTVVACACDCHADPQCDGVFDVLDVVHAVDVAFRNGPDIADPNPACPRTTTDVDCDSQTDVFDVVHLVAVAFRNELPGEHLCDPCGP